MTGSAPAGAPAPADPADRLRTRLAAFLDDHDVRCRGLFAEYAALARSGDVTTARVVRARWEIARDITATIRDLLEGL